MLFGSPASDLSHRGVSEAATPLATPAMHPQDTRSGGAMGSAALKQRLQALQQEQQQQQMSPPPPSYGESGGAGDLPEFPDHMFNTPPTNPRGAADGYYGSSSAASPPGIRPAAPAARAAPQHHSPARRKVAPPAAAVDPRATAGDLPVTVQLSPAPSIRPAAAVRRAAPTTDSPSPQRHGSGRPWLGTQRAAVMDTSSPSLVGDAPPPPPMMRQLQALADATSPPPVQWQRHQQQYQLPTSSAGNTTSSAVPAGTVRWTAGQARPPVGGLRVIDDSPVGSVTVSPVPSAAQRRRSVAAESASPPPRDTAATAPPGGIASMLRHQRRERGGRGTTASDDSPIAVQVGRSPAAAPSAASAGVTYSRERASSVLRRFREQSEARSRSRDTGEHGAEEAKQQTASSDDRPTVEQTQSSLNPAAMGPALAGSVPAAAAQPEQQQHQQSSRPPSRRASRSASRRSSVEQHPPAPEQHDHRTDTDDAARRPSQRVEPNSAPEVTVTLHPSMGDARAAFIRELRHRGAAPLPPSRCRNCGERCETAIDAPSATLWYCDACGAQLVAFME